MRLADWFSQLARQNKGNRVSTLTRKLTSKNQVTRWETVKDLAQLAAERNSPADREDIVKALIGALDDAYYLVRKEAARALGILHAEAAIPQLISLLKDQDYRVRASTAQSLGQLRASSALSGLSDGTRDPNAAVRRACVNALGELRDTRAIDTLIDRLGDPQWEVRFDAVMALANIGTASVPRLLDVARSGAKEARVAALNALEELPSNKALAVLQEVYNDDDFEIRRAAAAALRALQERSAQERPDSSTDGQDSSK